jgi:flagellar biosynthesis protein FlhA
VAELNQWVTEALQQTSSAVVLCSPMIRHHLKTLVDRFIPGVIVLSHNEITANVNVKSIGTVTWAA